ncbi:MAG: tetratricopeptide repeat protein [Arenimonas sp.]
MNRIRMFPRWSAPAAMLAVLLTSLLSACTGSTSSALGDSRATTTKLDSNSMVMRVRAAGQIGNELDVQPLRDPQVEDLRGTAALAESRGDFATAKRALSQALLVTPEDPDLLQWQAELALATRDWPQAEQLATRSFASGPKLGGLCRRNWTTLRFAAEARGNSVAAAQAQQRLTACTVAPPTRM